MGNKVYANIRRKVQKKKNGEWMKLILKLRKWVYLYRAVGYIWRYNRISVKSEER